MGREFIDLFNGWAASYDKTVAGDDIEYRDVFQGYDAILKAVVAKTNGPNVLEFGVGTGNLTRQLINEGHHVYGIEPSMEMLKIGQLKVPEAKIQEGDFIDFTVPSEPIHSIVSSYAFHHLTDEEKEEAIEKYSELLASEGVIVFADTVFESQQAKRHMIEKAIASYFHNLAEDLSTEHYSDIPTLTTICRNHGFDVMFEQLNPYVWLMVAKKK
ncbi:methyltransferase domain-containing protein [Pontibacillus yanchengensis]|uniref:Uncharacterized methyltransferase GLW05_18255 n=1 Tax=Pontibacillus yanchengensis TaxID=462910 RepID=A0A6I5A597_9BACI|nr:class I SAM-dependent methyltransferase [Pontibacillus yanchengensis]MYL35525.1 methyltransferase domain-containing protein [Pontibacillus yanchengensis]